LEGCVRIATTEIKPDTRGLLKQQQRQIPVSLMIDFVKEEDGVMC
jgi:hypothetical protein